MSDERPENEDAERPEEDGSDDAELPPPATWAGRRSHEDEDAEAEDEKVGRGITEEFSLSDEVPGEEGPAPDEPPVEEPPDPEAPEPVEEPSAPGAPPSGETEEFVPREFAPISDEFDSVQPVTHRHEEPDSEEPDVDEPPSEEPEADEPASEEPEAEETISEEPEAEAESDQPSSDPAAPGSEAEEAAGSDVSEGDDSGEEAGTAGDAAGSDLEPEE